MTFVDDDAPRHIDFIDNPLASAQSRRAARLELSSAYPEGLKDRRYIPQHRRPRSAAPIKVVHWN